MSESSREKVEEVLVATDLMSSARLKNPRNTRNTSDEWSKKSIGNQKEGNSFSLKAVTLWLRQFLIGLIQVYKKDVSPFKPRTCRFYPSCSTYAEDALDRYGVLKGSALTLRRILKCNPFHPGGFDPLE